MDPYENKNSIFFYCPRQVFGILLGISLLLSCSTSDSTIHEPDYHPQLIRLGRPLKTTFKTVVSDIDFQLDTLTFREERIGDGRLVFNPIGPEGPPVKAPAYTPAALKKVDMSAVAPPERLTPQFEKGPFFWPVREEAQMDLVSSAGQVLYFLGVQQGLKSNVIRHIYEDSKGHIWISTMGGGVSVWDGLGLTHFTIKNGLKINDVKCVLEDREGRIWIGTNGGGINIWDGHQWSYLTTDQGLPDNNIYDLLMDREGNIWIATWKGGICSWDGKTLTHYTTRQGLSGNFAYQLEEDDQGHIWVATPGYGISIWDGQGFSHLTTQQGLCSDNVTDILKDREGHIWIATGSFEGLNLWDGQGLYHYTREQGLNTNTLEWLEEDDQGHIWIGTWDGGVNIWDGKGFSYLNTDQGLAGQYVWHMRKDSWGRVWIGTNGRGVSIWQDLGYTQLENDEREVFAMAEDSEGRVWIGRNDLTILKNWEKATFSNLGAFNTRDILEWSKNRIWIATENGGLVFWDGRYFTRVIFELEERFVNFLSLQKTRNSRLWIGTDYGPIIWDGEHFFRFPTEMAIGDLHVNQFLEDNSGNLWFGTRSGVLIWDGKSLRQLTTKEGLCNNNITTLVKDHRGRIWIGTFGGGINIWDGIGLNHISIEQGLSHGHVFSLVVDYRGDIWAGTFNGLNHFRQGADPAELYVKHYDARHGLESGYIRSLMVDRQNHLWVDGPNRLNLAQLPLDTFRPNVYISNLQPFFDAVDWRQAKDSLEAGVDLRLSSRDLSMSGIRFDSVLAFTNLPVSPVFPHHIDQLTFHWTAPHPSHHPLKFSYRLEGKDNFWSPLIKDAKMSFNGLRPGDYSLLVRAVAGNGHWSDTAEYAFSIAPPWWATWWAYTLFALMVFGIIISFYRFQLKRRLAHAEARRLKELDVLKTRLFTNITHEFRTPLTVISGMADQALEDPESWVREGLSMIKRNSRQLLGLVNQLLDLSKLESGSLPVKLIRDDIIAYLKYLTEFFHSYAESKDIRLHLLPGIKKLEMDFDPEKIQSIFTNLVGNAIKFTPAGGDVYITVDGGRQSVDGRSLLIRVKDNGVGIPAAQLPYIFDRFYQADNSSTRPGEGTGIGLSLTKELVKLFGGSIEVNSQEGAGTEFIIALPVSQRAEKGVAADITRESLVTEGDIQPAAVAGTLTLSAERELPLALLIEDHRDVLQYLAACLQGQYRLEMAANGREGIEKAIDLVPDIIISDVMMPEKDGFEVVDTLKQDRRTSHIPIILLTAKADIESRLEGLERGADAYLAKPFDKKELEIRLRKLIGLRQQLQERYGSLEPGRPEENGVVLQEVAFLSKIRELVEAHLEEENFGIAKLCLGLGVSRAQLHRKLKALTGKSTSQVIRTIRMKKAKELLQNRDLNVSQVGFAVGYTNASYFTQEFIREFGEAPSRFRGDVTML